MIDISKQFNEEIARKIFGNKENATTYLKKRIEQDSFCSIPMKNISRGKLKGEKVIDLTGTNIWKIVVDSWDYTKSINIIRDIFKNTTKYKDGIDAVNSMNLLIQEWEGLNLGIISWPFSQGDFDGFVQKINSSNDIGTEKDEKVKNAAVKYRRIKEINTVRNDYIETLIFEKHETILPTLNHRRNVDYFINAVAYDQKVAKSPTLQFKNKFKENWKEVAIRNPNLVAKYLYSHQDEGRFGADPRLLVVYLDEDVKIERISKLIEIADLINPIEIDFTFKHKIQGMKAYKVSCFIVLLYNK